MIRVGHLEFRVVLQPVPLVDCVVPFVCWVASVKVNEKSSILQYQGVRLNRPLEIHTDQSPLHRVRAWNAVRDKKMCLHLLKYSQLVVQSLAPGESAELVLVGEALALK